MASYFVSSASGAGGAGNGSSWANAYLTIAAAIARPLVGGDTLFIGDDHSESVAATITLSVAGSSAAAPVNLLVVDHTKASPGQADLKVGANGAGSIVTTTAGVITWAGHVFVYGLYMAAGVGSSANNISITVPGARAAYFERCTFVLGSTGTGCRVAISTGSALECRNCTFTLNTATQSISPDRSFVKFVGCTFTFGGTQPTNLFNTGLAASLVICEGCDFSAATNPLVNGNAGGDYRYTFKDCKLPTGTVADLSTSPNTLTNNVWIVNSDNAATNYRNELYDYNGVLTTSLTVVRTGGASFGTAYAWKVVTTANNSWMAHFRTMAISIWNVTTGGVVNVTVEGIADPRDFSALPNNDDIWFDVEALQNATAPIGGYITATKASPLASNTALTASTAAWDSAATARANSNAYSLGNIYKAASNPGRLFLCTTAGTSAASEPGGVATAVDGDTVTDGSATFKAMWRFKQTITTAAIQFAGFITVYPKVGKASLNGIYIDPVATLT